MCFSVILIEIAIMLIGFTVLVFGMLLINPLTFISDYPPGDSGGILPLPAQGGGERKADKADACKKTDCRGCVSVPVCLDTLDLVRRDT